MEKRNGSIERKSSSALSQGKKEEEVERKVRRGWSLSLFQFCKSTVSRLSTLYRVGQSAVGANTFTWMMLFFVLAILVKFVVFSVIALHDDEAYYWIWSRHLQLGYPSHPPGVAFFSWLGIKLFGVHDISPRLLATFSYLALSAVCVLWALKQRIFSTATSVGLAKLERMRLAIIMPMLLVFVPQYYALTLVRADTVMILFSILAIFSAHFALFHSGRKNNETKADLAKSIGNKGNWFWLAAGVFWGLALISKVTTLFLLAGYAAFFILAREGRKAWRKSFFYIHGAVMVAFFASYIVYDAQYSFISLRTLIFRTNKSFSWDTFFAFHAEQPVLFFPSWYLLFLFMFLIASVYYVLSGFAALRKKTGSGVGWLDSLFARRSQEKFFFFLLSAPAMVYFIVRPFSQNQQANWTVFAPLGLMILLAIVFSEQWRNRFWRYSFVGSAVAVSLVYVFLMVSVFKPVIPAPADPFCLYQKYEFIPQRFANFYKNKMDHQWQIASPDYKLASMLSIYAPLGPDFKKMSDDVSTRTIALSIDEIDPVLFDQSQHMPEMYYWLWSMVLKKSDVAGKMYFFSEVGLEKGEKEVKKLEANLSESFASYRFVKEFASQCRGVPIARFRLYEVENYRHDQFFLPKKALF